MDRISHFLWSILILWIVAVEPAPINPPWVPIDWSTYFPGLNSTYAELCYTNRFHWDEMGNASLLCPEISNRSAPLTYPSSLMTPLRQLYHSLEVYDLYEQDDKRVVLDTFLKDHKGKITLTATSGTNDSVVDELVNQKRKSLAKKYHNQLVGFQEQVDWCLEAEAEAKYPATCIFLNERFLAEHCYLFHMTVMPFKPCFEIMPDQIPLTVRTYFLSTLLKEMSQKFREEYLEKPRLVAAEYGQPAPPMSLVLECIHYIEWRSEPDHQCHSLVNPVPNVQYSEQDLAVQKLYTQTREQDRANDCVLYHQGDVYFGCEGKGITYND